MILNGYSIDEISRSLLISKKTVQSFVGIVLHKLNTTKISGIYRKKKSHHRQFCQEEPASLGCPIN
ncbi:LuxR C-terminal-related transcriptional regulator (plasmid) [Klebsiella pneumoniae]|nr:LuxR C-terminal-related transcriptional regulator [Klebsiella pneumoniae]